MKSATRLAYVNFCNQIPEQASGTENLFLYRSPHGENVIIDFTDSCIVQTFSHMLEGCTCNFDNFNILHIGSVCR